jgi:hypothetical protein
MAEQMADRMKKGDMLFAHIAINVAPRLSVSARRVAGALLEHYNRRTGRCDPGINRLRNMLELGRATIFRALDELCGGEHPFFERVSHGGKGGRNHYAPNWDVLRAVVDDFNRRMRGGGSASEVLAVRPVRSQDCDGCGLNSETQTLRKNPQKEPSARVDGNGERQATLCQPDRRRLGNKGMRRAETAKQAAHRRIIQDISKRRDPKLKEALFNLGEAKWEQADAAEIVRAGDGLETLLKVLGAE